MTPLLSLTQKCHHSRVNVPSSNNFHLPCVVWCDVKLEYELEAIDS